MTASAAPAARSHCASAVTSARQAHDCCASKQQQQQPTSSTPKHNRCGGGMCGMACCGVLVTPTESHPQLIGSTSMIPMVLVAPATLDSLTDADPIFHPPRA
jgi:hypothetical protein